MQDYTAEEVFRACLEPVLKRGTRAVDDNGHCSYEKGCAAGQLLSTVEARAFDEGESKPWDVLVREHLVPDHHCETIRVAQLIHDKPFMSYPVRQAKNYCENQGWSTEWLEQFDENTTTWLA